MKGDLGWAELKKYQKELEHSRHDPFNVEQEHELALMMVFGSSIARTRLIESSLRFVVRKARWFWKQCKFLRPMDVINCGNQGLMDVIDIYNPFLSNPNNNGEPYRILSYGEKRIIEEMQKCIREQENEIYMPYSRLKESGFDTLVKASLDQKLDESDDDESLNELFGEIDPLEHGTQEFLNPMLEGSDLTWLELETLKMENALADGIHRTIREISEILNCDVKDIRMAKNRAIQKVRNYLEGQRGLGI